MVVVLQPLDRHQPKLVVVLHVAGSGPQRLSSSDASVSSPDYAARLLHASIRRVTSDSGPTSAPAYGTIYHNTMVLVRC